MMSVPTPKAQRVVIIDDTEDLRDLLRLALTRGGFDVVAEAGDGQQGIEQVREQRPDIVLLDLAMPVMDGIEALPSLRRLVPDAKIVVLSGFGAQQMSARAVAAGADGYVQKGAPLNTILDYVREISAHGASKPARKLTVVPASTGMNVDTLGGVPATPMATPTHTEAGSAPAAGGASLAATAPVSRDETSRPDANVSAWEAMSQAPYGVVELADEPLFRVVYANPMAQRLLGTVSSGTPLGMVSGELSQLVSFHRLDSDAAFEVELAGGRVRATLRRTGWSVLVFLDSTQEDVGMLRRAISTTAHEIRGPVAVLCGIAETMGWADDIEPEQRDRLMESVARQAKMLDNITADLLTAAQIQRGTLRLDMQVVDPAQAVAAVVADRYEVEVDVQTPSAVRADPLRFEQMLTNLLSNAHKYGIAPYTLTIRRDGEHVCLDVVDQGDGVPPEFVGNLFREFARANDAVASGTGLGLYVVRTLAQAQNGDVTYAPGPDKGSVFTIKLLAC